MGLENVFVILKNLLLLVLVIVLANVVLRYISRYMSKNNNIIKIIERLSTNKDSSICVVMICGDYYLMSFNKEGHKILKDLDKVEVDAILKEKTESQGGAFSTKFYHGKNLKSKTKDYFEMGKKFE